MARHYADKRIMATTGKDLESSLTWRLRDNAFRAQANAERTKLYPVITLENFTEACDWYEARVRALHGGAK